MHHRTFPHTLAPRSSWGRILAGPLLLLTLAGCGGGNAQNLKPKDYHGQFEDTAQGLSFRCPSQWDVRENVQEARVIARAPLEAKDDPFRENLVALGPLKVADVATARTSTQATLRAQLEKYQEFPSEGDALLYTYEEKGRALESRAHFLPAKPTGVWMVVFTSTPDKYAAWAPEFDAVVKTFGQPLPKPEGSATPAVTMTPAVTATPLYVPLGGGTPAPGSSESAAATSTPAAASATPVATPASSSATPAPASGTATPTPASGAATPAPAAVRVAPVPVTHGQSTPARHP